MSSVQASLSVQAATAAPPPPPPPPELSAVEQGNLAAGRIHVVEGQVFAGQSPDAPQTRDWGQEPAGSAYRIAFDSAAARLGTRDPAAVGAELDRQLGIGQPAPPPAPPAAPPGTSPEGLGSVIEGAVLGDFGNNNSWSATAGQVGAGFIPVLGQIADARDTAAAIGQVWRGEDGGWLNLGAAAIGWVPGIGDAAKAAIRGGERVVDAGTEVAQGAARQTDEVAAAGADIARRQIVMNGGRRGEWPAELNARRLEPNADYIVNGYKYATDAQGRVVSVEGQLDLRTADRNSYQQQVAGREDRLPDDQGGHLIASIFNGPGDRLNLVPMNGNFNMGAWKAMENRLADALKDGKRVEVNIEVSYPSGSSRPDYLSVTYSIDGGRPIAVDFRNAAGGK